MTNKEFQDWLDLVRAIAPIKFKPEHRRHPLFHQWFQIAKGTTDPNYIQRRSVQADGSIRAYKPWDKYGANNIGMHFEWFDFDKFINDKVVGERISDLIANRNPNLNRRKFQNLELTCIDRIDRTGNFNRENIFFTNKAALPVDNKGTTVIETPFIGTGNVPIKMTLRELALYLVRNAGKPYPDGVGPFTLKHRVWDDDAGRAGKMVTKEVVYETIAPVSLAELRRRVKAGITDNRLYAPSRPKKKSRAYVVLDGVTYPQEAVLNI